MEHSDLVRHVMLIHRRDRSLQVFQLGSSAQVLQPEDASGHQRAGHDGREDKLAMMCV